MVLIRARLNSVLHVVKILPLPLSRVLSAQLIPDLPAYLLQIPLLLPCERVMARELHVLLSGHLELLVIKLQRRILVVRVSVDLGRAGGGHAVILEATVAGRGCAVSCILALLLSHRGIDCMATEAWACINAMTIGVL